MSKIYQNIGVLAHVDAGKTTLTEQMLYHMGAVRRPGSVDEGTAATDSLTVERERGISVRTATASGDWKGVTVNLIDTPGHVDFAGEVERSLAALDLAVVVVSAVEGVRAHTENILHALDQAGLPRVVFLNKIDRVGADPDSVLADLARVTRQIPLPLSRAAGMETDGVFGSARIRLIEGSLDGWSVTVGPSVSSSMKCALKNSSALHPRSG